MLLRTKKEVFEVKIKRGKYVGTFNIQPLDPEEREELRKEFSDYERVKGQLMPDPDFIGLKIARVQKEIKNWDAKNEYGDEIPCTNDNKRTAYLLNSDIIDEALNKASDMAGEVIKKKRAKEKN